MRTFEERVHAEIGETANPLYFEQLLRKNEEQLLEWLVERHDVFGRVLLELKSHPPGAEQSAYHLGLRIFCANVRELLFVANELKARSEAIRS